MIIYAYPLLQDFFYAGLELLSYV